MKAVVHSADSDTNFFNIVVGILQGDTLSLHLLIIWLDYVLRSSINLRKQNGFTFKKTRSRLYLSETDADYGDDQALLLNTPAQA